ncbi:5-methyltetrahydropteroyltriglutamate--homocysteine S-methyltransferase [Balneatrix alpica]|uniref:5-methyltetrahydropteroyltriglutamate-- homocysteine S-methyltransferase n=1 Tax=Balneatrix alpica TaxID=75684 RepID=UPI0027390A63|nr:5-methyltetrahydropteroyltriglutamate--homocysteine S-methyltransferase [Balneatrix alpica]
MAISHVFGFPRIGIRRELKFALESYWRGEVSAESLQQQAANLRAKHWQWQAEQVDYVAVNDFSFYDHMLDTAVLFGVIPARFKDAQQQDASDLDTYFRMARGRAPSGEPVAALEMTKWFDTNYHYLVPELEADQQFELNPQKILAELAEAQALGLKVKPVLVGPLTFLWLAKLRGSAAQTGCCSGQTTAQPQLEQEAKLTLLDGLLAQYQQLLTQLAAQGVEWLQLDEPVFSLDLPASWQQAAQSVYQRLAAAPLKILLANYFGRLDSNLATFASLPVAGLHVDAVRAGEEVTALLPLLDNEKILSVGIVDGRNVWRTPLVERLQWLLPLAQQLGQRLWLSSSCSLLHVPVDLEQEDQLQAELKQWLAFAKQRLVEIAVLTRALNGQENEVAAALAASQQAAQARQVSPLIHDARVKQRLAARQPSDEQRQAAYPERAKAQAAHLQLPLLPTTTIGSFPQTSAIRQARQAWRQGELADAAYQVQMEEEIRYCIKQQLDYGLDVLVHGEAERNDMVEYFGEYLQGYAFSRFGWVQSYGSRCVKPPLIYGDVSRPAAMTVAWSRYAQSLTTKPVKGMLTGPVTMLKWSFVRDDQPLEQTCLQIAYALRDEVLDLEQAGIKVIQIDEPAIREGLPLRRQDWQAYLDWAVSAFRISAAGVANDTQIHTHMCYAEFNDIIESIAAMDADVITIETSRSAMELLDAFVNFAYPNEIGPGVYDIHSPNVPQVEQMVKLMRKAGEHLPWQRLWINPDCGLKTRAWPETEAALRAMVQAARQLREELANQAA